MTNTDPYARLGGDATHAPPMDLPPVHVQPVGSPLAEAVSDSGEPFAPIPRSLIELNAYRWAGWPGTRRTMWLRHSVVNRLRRAASTLPEGYGLAVFDAWRSPATVRALWNHFYGPGSTLAPGFLADPDDPGMIPPHLTGGAVDLTLTWDGTPLNLGCGFDHFGSDAHADAFESDGRSTVVRQLRRLLHHAMSQAGFCGLAEEWWHFSWGDQLWAARNGTEPVFAAATPWGARPTPTAAEPADIAALELAGRWSAEGDALIGRFRCDSFESAAEFYARVAELAVDLAHHPTWTNTYRDVEVAWTTHDTGGITHLDLVAAGFTAAIFDALHET